VITLNGAHLNVTHSYPKHTGEQELPSAVAPRRSKMTMISATYSDKPFGLFYFP